MVTIQEARSQVNKAKQQIAEARQRTKEAREKAEKSRTQLIKQRQSLPQRKSQRALRDKLSGLQGRETRRKIKQAEEEIGGKVSKIKEYKKGLQEYEEKTINPFEKKVKAQESKVSAYKSLNESINRTLKENPGFISSRDARMVREAFAKAGLDPEEGERLYKEGVKSSIGYQYPKQVSENIQNITELSPKEFYSLSQEELGKLPKIQLQKLESIGAIKTDINKLNDRTFNMQTKKLMPDTFSMETQKSLIKDDRSFLDKTKSFVTNIFGGSKDGEISGMKDSQFLGTGAVVSAYSGEPIKSIEIPDKTFTEKVKSFPSNLVSGAKDFLRQQVELISAEKQLGIGNVASVDGRDVITIIQRAVTKPKELRKIETNINKIDAQIKELEKDKINNLGQFTGTENEANKINELYNKRNALTEKYNQKRNIKVGAFGTEDFSARRDVSSFDTSRPIRSVKNIVVSSIVGTGENIYFRTIGQRDIGKEISYLEPQFGTIQTDPSTGEEISQREIKKKLTKEDVKGFTRFVGVGAESAVDAGLYFTPIGGALFLGEGAELGVDITRKKIKGEEIPISEKVEAGLFVGFGALGGASAFKSFRTGRQFKALSKAEPDISLGFVKDIVGRDRLLVITTRESKGIRSRTAQVFDVAGRGNKFQIRGGKGVQEITRDSLLFRDAIKETTPFTFAGSTKRTTARAVPDKLGFQEGTFNLKRPIEDDVFESNIRILSDVGEDIKTIKARGFGVPRTKDIKGQPKFIDDLFVFGQEGEFTIGFGGALKSERAIKKPDVLAYFGKEKVTLTSPITGFKASPEEGFIIKRIKEPKVEILGLRESRGSGTSITKSGNQLEELKFLEDTTQAGGVTAITTESRLVSSLEAPTKEFKRFPLLQETKTKTKTKTETLQLEQPKNKFKVDLLSKSSIGSKTKTKSISLLDTKLRQKQLEKPIEQFKQKPVELFKEATKTKTQQKTKQISKTKTQTKKQKPPIKPSKITRIFDLASGKSKPTEKERSIFEAVGIRFGKEVKLGKGTKKQAEKKLEGFLTKTLGASGFLTEKGQKVGTSLTEKKGFRKSKLDPFKVVEKKERRLKKGTKEVSEIQFFKQKGSSKGKKKVKNLLGI